MNSTITTQTVKTLNFQAFRGKKRQKVGCIHPHHMYQANGTFLQHTNDEKNVEIMINMNTKTT
jgi:hypothetical protein